VRKILSFLVLLFSVYGLFSQSASESSWAIRPGLRIWGLSLEVGYTSALFFDENPTEIALGVSSAYQTEGYFRKIDGTYISETDFTSDNRISDTTEYSQFNFISYLGLRQSLGNNFWIDGFYRLWYNFNFLDDLEASHILVQTTLPDKQRSLSHSFLLALRYAGTKVRPVSTLVDGFTATLSGEVAPGALNPIGEASYLRGTLELEAFLPLYENIQEDTQMNSFSLGLNFMSITDFTKGLDESIAYDGVPTHARQKFGGLVTRGGLGGTVRGFEDGRFDGSFKNAQSIELRMMLPTLFVPGLLPLAVVYTDLGFWGLPLDGGSFSSDFGAIGSFGGGIGIDLFGFGTLIAYTHYALGEKTLSGGSWTPFGLGFGFHF